MRFQLGTMADAGSAFELTPPSGSRCNGWAAMEVVIIRFAIKIHGPSFTFTVPFQRVSRG